MDKLQMENPAPLRKTGLTSHFLGFSPTIDFSHRSGAVQYDALHRAIWDHKSTPHDRIGAEASWLHSGWEHQSDSSGIDASLKSGVDDAAAAALCRSWDCWDDSAVLQHKRRAADERRQQPQLHVGGGEAALGMQDCGSLLSDDRSAAVGKAGFPPTAAISGSRIIPFACKLDVAAAECRDVGFATLSARAGFNGEEERYVSGNKSVSAGGFQVKVEMDETPKTVEVDTVGLEGLGPLRESVGGRSHHSLTEMGAGGKERRTDELKAKREIEQEGGTVGSMGDATIGLKLGKRTYFEDGAAGAGGAGSRAASSSPNSTGNNNNSSNNTHITTASSNRKQKSPRCQAEGCKSDLSSAKEYHRRHKVCPMHSKASKVKVGNPGIEQRFCQQCSRFHVLTEFDEGKRSCRRRLAGHNERRRKPQPVAMSLLSSANFPYQTGDKHLLNGALLEHPCFLQQHQHQHQRPSFSSSLDHAAALACQLRFPGAESQVLKLLRIPKEEPATSFPSLELQHFMQGSGTLVGGHGLALSNPPGAMNLGSEALSLASQPPSGISVSGRALSLLSSPLVSQDNPISMSLGVSSHPSLAIEQLLADNQGCSSHQIVSSSSAGQPCFTPQSITNSNGSVTGSPDTMDKDPREPPSISDFEGRSMFIMLQDNNFHGLHGGDSQHGRPILDLMQISSPQSQGSRPASLQQPIEVQYTEFEGIRSYESMFGSQNIM